ncbi:MAG: VWA domain-containing protein [Planctomycetota bacterium]|nr:VWA domain-containing protein [Planctomycetota bacterium]
MKINQTKTLFSALSLAILPGLWSCQSQSEETAQEASSGAAQTVESSVLVQTGQVGGSQEIAGAPLAQQTGNSPNRFAGGDPTNVEVTVLPTTEPIPTVLPVAVGSNVIDLAICLDTSGSMDGLIDSAKQTLWSIVNDLALVEPAPTLRVALLTFGNDRHSEENGWVLVDSPLTTDLDIISQKLFALTTDGGTEYVGRVVDAATTDLDWSPDPGALKLLVVAGNESADQDPTILFRDASKKAITAGIMVNSIYCGNPMDELAPAWREVSLLADGHFSSIDQNNGMIVIDTPFDEELSALTASVNTTYIPWGQGGQAAWTNQTAQDDNNRGLNNDAMAQRALAKNSKLYSCSWDLVDACKADQVKIEDVDRKFLSEELQKMTDSELEAYIKGKADERAQIQANVAKIAAKREVWLTEERMKLKVDDSNALDRVMRDAIRAQAATKGIQFKKTAPATTEASIKPDDC